MLALPAEIWIKVVVSNLSKQDIVEASTVCKTWNVTLTGFFGDPRCVSVNNNKFKKLLKDLLWCPGFASRITKLTITSQAENVKSTVLLRDILNQCPSLLVLAFTQVEVFQFLKMINSKKTRLPNIQQFDIQRLSNCESKVKQFYIWINYRFRATIKSLQITDIQKSEALMSYGGLTKYLSCFPYLAAIRISGTHFQPTRLSLTLDLLLLENSELEELSISSIKCVRGDLHFVDASYPSLKKLHLHSVVADIDILAYI